MLTEPFGISMISYMARAGQSRQKTGYIPPAPGYNSLQTQNRSNMPPSQPE